MPTIVLEKGMDIDYIKRLFEKKLKDLDFKISVTDVGENTEIFFESEEKLNYNDYYLIIEVILKIYEKYFLKKAIENRIITLYGIDFYKGNDNLISEIKSSMKSSSVYYEERINLRNEILEYFSDESKINLLGFFTFRMRKYNYVLDLAINRVVLKIKEEEKINETLNIIQDVVKTKDSKIDILNLTINENEFRLYDMYGKIVGVDIEKEIREELDSLPATKADILLSVLIVIAPKRLILHYSGKEELFIIEAIERIFENRLVHCPGCKMCQLD